MSWYGAPGRLVIVAVSGLVGILGVIASIEQEHPALHGLRNKLPKWTI